MHNMRATTCAQVWFSVCCLFSLVAMLLVDVIMLLLCIINIIIIMILLCMVHGVCMFIVRLLLLYYNK